MTSGQTSLHPSSMGHVPHISLEQGAPAPLPQLMFAAAFRRLPWQMDLASGLPRG